MLRIREERSKDRRVFLPICKAPVDQMPSTYCTKESKCVSVYKTSTETIYVLARMLPTELMAVDVKSA